MKTTNVNFPLVLPRLVVVLRSRSRLVKIRLVTAFPVLAKIVTGALAGASIFCMSNSSTEADSYISGYSWQRSAEWTIEPDAYAGTTNGNPTPDPRGNPVWSYEWVQGGGGIGTSNPWYA